VAGFLDRFGPFSNTAFKASDALKTLSNMGMRYDDMVLRQSQAIGVMEDKYGFHGTSNLFGSMGQGAMQDDFWYPFAAMSMTDVSMRKNISFFDMDYKQRRNELRQFSTNDEVEDILDTMCDEAIVYDDRNFFASPNFGSSDVSDEVRKDINKSFNNIYQYFGFNQDQSAWTFFRKWLIDGYLAFEIIYDEDQKEIIGFKELDPATLIPGVDPETNKKVWIQNKDEHQKERKLYDSQIIYLSYSSISLQSRSSYVERLVRSFNLLRIMEHTRIIWAVTNASYKMKFVIPVGGKSKTRAKQSLAALMNNYREVVDFDYESGKMEVNGKPMMQFNKEYWLPSKEGERPEIETLADEGPDLSDTEALTYFSDKLKLASKIPFTRFEYGEGRGDFEMSGDSLIREEIKFSKFINRLRSSFQEILIKPLYIQVVLKYPELKDDMNFRANLSLSYNQENMFAELKEIEIMTRRLDFISSMKNDLTFEDADMNEIPYFDLNFLIERYLKMSPDDLEKNKGYKEKLDKEDDEEDLSDLI